MTKRCTDHYWNKLVTREVNANQSQKQTEKFELHESVLWFGGCLKHEDNVTSEDVEADVFYDSGTISFCSPVVMLTSAIYQLCYVCSLVCYGPYGYRVYSEGNAQKISCD